MKKILIIFLVVAVLLVVTVALVRKSEPKSGEDFAIRGRMECASNPNPVFTHHFTDLSKIDAIGMLGGYGGGSPGRSYVSIKKGFETPVYAPMDATLETIIYAPRGPDAPPEYGFYFRASCEVTFLLDHVDKVSDELKPFALEKPAPSTRTEEGSHPNVLIKAGTLLGYSDGTPLARTFDFLVMNRAKPVFHINPSRWEWDQALYASCPPDYYQGDLRGEHYAKVGVIDDEGFKPEKSCGSPSQDVAGTALGGWFKNDATDMKGDFLGVGQTSYLIQLVVRRDGNIVYRLDHYLSFSGSRKKPVEIKQGESVCYSGNNVWAWMKLEKEDVLLLAKGEGVCPENFPLSQAETWHR